MPNQPASAQDPYTPQEQPEQPRADYPFGEGPGQPSPQGSTQPVGQAQPYSPEAVEPGSRVLARIIDTVLLSFVLGLPIALVKYVLLGFLSFNSSGSGDIATVLLNDKIVSTVSYVLFYVAIFLNDAVLVAFKGANIGKLLVGLRVTDANTGNKPTFGQATIRMLVYFSVPMVFSLIAIWVTNAVFQSLAILSYIWAPILLITIAVSPPNFQGWHDRAARTTVTKKPPL